MAEVSVRELRNCGAQVLDRVERGESMTVTRDGVAVAVLAPAPARRLSAQALVERWRNVPAIDAGQLRTDVSDVLNLDL